MASSDSDVPKLKQKGKSLSWKVPHASKDDDVDMNEDLLLAERLTSAVRDSIHELLPSALRDATATTLQKLSVVTLKMSNLLDRMEMANMDEVTASQSLALGAMSPRSVNSSVTLLEKPRPTTSVVSMERIADSCEVASQTPSSHSSVQARSGPGPGEKVSPSTYQSLEIQVTLPVRGATNAIATAAKTRKAVSVQGWNGSLGDQEIFLPLPPNTPRRSIDESAGASSDYLKSKSPKLEKMGMKSLETRLARELFKTAKKPGTKGLSWNDDCSVAALSRQNSKGKAIGEHGRSVLPEADGRIQAVLRRGPSRESLPNSVPSSWNVLNRVPQAPAVSKPQCPEAPAGLIPEMPMPLPVIPSQDLQIQNGTTNEEGSGPLNEDEGDFAPNSQENLRKDVGPRNNTDPLTDGQPKRNVTSITSRSKKGSVQLRDANNEELIRATIKSVNKISPLSETDPLGTMAGNRAVGIMSAVNCSAIIYNSRVATLLFHGVLAISCLLSLGWLVTDVILQFMAMQDSTGHSYFVYDVALSFGALLCLLCGGCLRFSTPVAECEAMLDAFADERNLHEDWLQKCRWDALIVSTIWLLSVVERARELFADGLTLHQDVDQQEIVNNLCNLASFMVSGGVLLACLFRVMRVCRGFYVIIDDFSFNLVTTSDLCVAEQDWNLLQALLRRSCAALQYLFIVLQSTIVAALILGVDDFYRLAKPTSLISGAFVLIGLAPLFLCAASVTDHCERLPPFVNSLGFGRSLDADRLYLVEYMFYSQAGFYIFEVRVTRDMVLKAFYISGMAIFYFATKVMASGF